jgi:hypothetical protein
MIEFLKWIGENNWHRYKDGKWFTTRELPYIDAKPRKFYTEAQLVKIFNDIQNSKEKAIVKFNSGNLALLCSMCRRVVKTGVDFNEEENKFAKGEIDYLDPLYCKECKND